MKFFQNLSFWELSYQPHNNSGPAYFPFWNWHATLHPKAHTHTSWKIVHPAHLLYLVSNHSHLFSFLENVSKLPKNNMQPHHCLCVTNTLKASTCPSLVIISGQDVKNKFICIWNEFTSNNNVYSLRQGVTNSSDNKQEV